MSVTRADVERLKSDWLKDPCYDIESTIGFENFEGELLAFRLETEARQSATWTKTLEDKAEAIGCPLNLQLAGYVLRLEDNIDRLTARLDELESRR